MEIWRCEATETNTRNNKSLRVTNLWSPSTSLQMRRDELEWELGNGSEPCDENRWAWVRVPRLYFHPPCLLPPHFHLVFIFRVLGSQQSLGPYHISTLSLFSGSITFPPCLYFQGPWVSTISRSPITFPHISTLSLFSGSFPRLYLHFQGSQQSPLGPYISTSLFSFSGSLGLNNLGPYLGPPLNNLPSHFLW